MTPQPSKDINDKLRDIVVFHVRGPKDTFGRNLTTDETVSAIIKLFSETLNDCLPEKQTRKPDEEYMYCITCNQNIDTLEADCFCSIHNLAIDQTKQNLIGELGEK